MKIGLGISPMFRRGGDPWPSYWATLNAIWSELMVGLKTEDGLNYLIQE